MKPVCHNYWTRALEPESHNYWALELQLPKLEGPRAHAQHQEKPIQWEAHTLQLEAGPHLLQWRPSTAKQAKKNFKFSLKLECSNLDCMAITKGQTNVYKIKC